VRETQPWTGVMPRASGAVLVKARVRGRLLPGAGVVRRAEPVDQALLAEPCGA
jgi:hypothetical protein